MNKLSHVALLLFLASFGSDSLAQSSTITTYAGLGHLLPVSGTQAITQDIGVPSCVVPDSAGGFYFASLTRVYRVALDGRLAVIAGTGAAGFSGDGGPAFSAQLAFPTDLVLDAAGNLFIADLQNHRIRK